MRHCTKLLLAILFAFVIIGEICSAQERSAGTSGPVRMNEALPELDLSILAPGVTYSFSAGSDEPLKIQPLRQLAKQLMPMYDEFEGYQRAEQFALSPNKTQMSSDRSLLKRGMIAKQTATSTATTYYSGMFATASVEWYWALDHNNSSFQSLLTARGNDGFRIESIDIYPTITNTDSRYAGIWKRDNLGWAWGLNYSESDFIALLNSHGQQGRRIVDIEFDTRARLYGGVWIVDGKGWYWALNFNDTQISQALQDQKTAGRRLIDFRVYPNANNTAFLYAAVWVNNTEGYAWAWALNFEWTNFVTELNTQAAANSRLIDYEIYQTSQGPRYAGIWVNDGQAWAYVLNDNSQASFVNEIDTLKTKYNLQPVSFEMFTDFSSGVENKPSQIEDYVLEQNYPNPFNATTDIKFAIPQNAFVTLKVYNLLGAEVATLVNESRAAGQYTIQVPAEKLGSGIYFYRLDARGSTSYTQMKKMTLLK